LHTAYDVRVTPSVNKFKFTCYLRFDIVFVFVRFLRCL